MNSLNRDMCKHTFRGQDDLHWYCVKCGIPSPNTKEEKWEQDFDSRFSHWDVEFEMGCEFLLNNTDGRCNCEHDEIKSFIRTLLEERDKQARASERQMIIKVIKCLNCNDTHEPKDKIIKAISAISNTKDND